MSNHIYQKPMSTISHATIMTHEGVKKGETTKKEEGVFAHPFLLKSLILRGLYLSRSISSTAPQTLFRVSPRLLPFHARYHGLHPDLQPLHALQDQIFQP